MLSAILAFISQLPVIGSMVTGVVTAVTNGKMAIATAQAAGNADVAKAMLAAQSAADAARATTLATMAHGWMLVLVFLFALPLIIFEWKVVVWDTVLDLGTTEPIRGEVASWAHTIVVALFGSSSILAIGQMYFSSKGQK